MNSQPINSDKQLNQHLWTIAIALPNAQNRTIARFHNRQDAEDHLRVLQRFIPKGKFEIVFDTDSMQAVDDVMAQTLPHYKTSTVPLAPSIRTS
jgi:hypothetical protein